MTLSRLPKLLSQGITTAVAMSVLAGAGFAAEITGAGSTFVYPILSKWSTTYSTQTGNKINYQSIGSGGGIAQIKAATVTFGASDKPLTPEELEACRSRAIPGGDRWRRTGRESGGNQGGPTEIHGTAPGRYIYRQNYKVERSGDHRHQSGNPIARSEDHGGASLGRFRHYLQLGQLFIEGERRMEEQGWRRHFCELAD